MAIRIARTNPSLFLFPTGFPEDGGTTVVDGTLVLDAATGGMKSGTFGVC